MPQFTLAELVAGGSFTYSEVTQTLSTSQPPPGCSVQLQLRALLWAGLAVAAWAEVLLCCASADSPGLLMPAPPGLLGAC